MDEILIIKAKHVKVAFPNPWGAIVEVSAPVDGEWQWAGGRR